MQSGRLLMSMALFFTLGARAVAGCGEVISVATLDDTTTRYALSRPDTNASAAKPVVLVLLPGGGGHLDLDEEGCPQMLTGNSLVRSIPLFRARGYITALVDARKDYTGEDGLGGFRTAKEHAQDLGAIIVDLRNRTNAEVWVIGNSRGTISAVNAASRLQAPGLPDGVVLTSAVTNGSALAKKDWVADSVFDLPLENIRIPFLLLGHEEDKCIRTPPDKMPDVFERIASPRRQMVRVTGGPGDTVSRSLKGCRGRSPHGYLEQEEEVVAGIDRFIRAGKY